MGNGKIVRKVLGRLESDIRYRDRLEHVEVLPPQKPVYRDVEDLPHAIQDYLERKNIKLYQHQYETLKHLRAGENVIITTPTASGKTMAFNLPILEDLSQDIAATALYIYPAKALANDQLKTLEELELEFKIDINPNIYDGDTPRNRKQWIRQNSRIILTNPYELHLVLSWHHQWSGFFKGIKYVVIDEAHQYRGVFGSNVAFLIRRLRRICRFYGSDPQFVLSSATLANPEEFSEKLTGKKFELVSKDGSPAGRKYFILYNPYFDGEGKISAHQETKNLFLFFVLNNLQTLCFTVSRKMAELIALWSKNDMEEIRPDLIGKITSYRAGYLPKERRKIEESLKSGVLKGVTTTNALELGINIGSLDGVIISGFPGTLISTWQQAGRAGRGHDDSLVVLVAFENPLDQYLMKHPESVFEKPHEHAIIDLQNPQIISGHMMCAASELPLKTGEFNGYIGDETADIKKSLQRQDLIQKTGDGWTYRGDDVAAFKVNLDSVSSDRFRVIFAGKLLETMDREHAYREAHEGAVLINRGETYLVVDFNLKKRTIHVVKKDVGYHTQVMKDIDVEILEKTRKKDFGSFSVFFGDLEVSEYYHKYKIMNHDKVVAIKKLDLPPLRFKTKGLWFTLPERVRDELEDVLDEKDVFDGGLHGVEHAMISMIPFNIMCDRFDIGGMSTSYHPDTGDATIFIYDAFEGGIGLAEKASELFGEIIKRTYELVRDCKCEVGCPACIYSPKCGNDNKPLSKRGTIFILEKIMDMMVSRKKNPEDLKITSKKDAVNGDFKEKPQDIVETQSFEKIVHALLSDPNGKVRAKAAYLLGETGDPSFVSPLCRATKDDNGNVRRLAASALGKIGNPQALDALCELLGDEKPQVRQYAVKALGKIGDGKALAPLNAIKDDDVLYVRECVRSTIKQMNDECK